MEPHHFSSKTVQMSKYATNAILTGYRAMNEIVRECMRMAPNATIVMMTALSQQPLLRYEDVGGRCTFKPIDPQDFIQFAGIPRQLQILAGDG